jgi:hypothetical protein
MMPVANATACLSLILLGACTDLASVSRFAKSGTDATSATDVFTGYVAAEAIAVRLAYPPTNHPTADQINRKKTAQAQYDAAPAFAAVEQAGLRALALYFDVLANLASDKLIDVKDTANSIGTSLKSLGVTTSASAAPVTSLIQLLLSAPLDAWRNRAVGNLITAANDDVKKLCDDLSTSAQAVAVAWGADINLANAYYGGVPGPGADIRGAVLMATIADQKTSTFSQNQQKATALAEALTKLGKGQKELYDNVGKLDLQTLQAILNGYSAEIESAAKLLQK